MQVGPSLDLRPVHHAPRGRIERITSVHRAAIVPQHQVTLAPLMAPAKPVAVDMFPKLLDQRFGLGQIQTIDIGIPPAAKIQRGAPGFGMGVDNECRLPGASRGSSLGVTPWRRKPPLL